MISLVETKLKEPAPVDLEIYVEKLINRCIKTVNILTALSHNNTLTPAPPLGNR